MRRKRGRIFVDLDGVVVDFDRFASDRKLTPQFAKGLPNAYRDMQPIPGALIAIKQLIEWGYDVWIATKPPTGVIGSYSDKAWWVINYLPELTKKLIITPDKGLLGNVNDFLIDDRILKANCLSFSGFLIEYKKGTTEWSEILYFFDPIRETERNFPEDFSHENGNYINVCTTCKNKFTGNKRRITCKLCENINVSLMRDAKHYLENYE